MAFSKSIAFVGLLATIALFSIFMNGKISSQNLTVDLEELECGFTDHFQKWLQSNGYSSMKFDRPDLKCPSLGGKTDKK